jgi:hypothetical protein
MLDVLQKYPGEAPMSAQRITQAPPDTRQHHLLYTGESLNKIHTDEY